MKRIWEFLGRVLFWMVWPLLYFYVRIGARTRVLIICGNEVLAVKGWLGSGKWSLPGGGLHHLEDPKQGAIREVGEEVGIRLHAVDLTPLGATIISQYRLASYYHQFVVEMINKPSLDLQKLEILTAGWLPINTLDTQSVGNDIIEVVGTWKKLTKAAKL